MQDLTTSLIKPFDDCFGRFRSIWSDVYFPSWTNVRQVLQSATILLQSATEQIHLTFDESLKNGKQQRHQK